MSRAEYNSLRSNAEVVSRAVEERPEYSDSWMEEVQVAQQERKL
jgi:hypothetical protein